MNKPRPLTRKDLRAIMDLLLEFATNRYEQYEEHKGWSDTEAADLCQRTQASCDAYSRRINRILTEGDIRICQKNKMNQNSAT